MARTALTITDLGLNSAQNPVSYDTGDSANNHTMENDGRTFLVLKNDTGGAVAVDVKSVADAAGRTGDISISVADGDETVIPPLPRPWWNQAGTNVVNIDVDGSIKIAALSLPNRAP